MLLWTIIIVLEANEKIESLCEEIKDVTKSHMETLQLKNRKLKIKNSMKRTEKKSHWIWRQTIQIKQSKKETGRGENKTAWETCGTITKDWKFVSSEFQRGKGVSAEKVIKEIISEILPNFPKEINPQIQQAKWVGQTPRNLSPDAS